MRSKQKKKTGRTAFKVLLALVLIIAICIIGGYNYVKNYESTVDPMSDEFVSFEVPKGASTTRIAKLLKEAGLIKNDTLFKYKSKFCKLDGKYQAGEYELSPAMNTSEIMAALQDAKRETTRITIKEGWSLIQIANYLEEQGVVKADDFYKSLENDNFDQNFVSDLKDTAPDPTGHLTAHGNRLEGFLFPETYDIYVGSSAKAIINKMLNQFEKVFDEELQKKLKENNLSLQEAITIASLIEGETQLDKERSLVSSVIYNRLNGNATGKKLQFCSSILYALGYHKDRVLYADLEIESPYNTYINPGLPAGPINSPGLACIKAALNPANTDYLYFVVSTKGDGSHNFTSKYTEHEQNAAQYQGTLN
ncbi:MAG: endolytic transglycosylase MltG [Bacillota bacterium]|nr:endolytic transglycosylase MltG [Bacillota bacterium]